MRQGPFSLHEVAQAAARVALTHPDPALSGFAASVAQVTALIADGSSSEGDEPFSSGGESGPDEGAEAVEGVPAGSEVQDSAGA
eukprot:4732031-Alexandrium_andersonii.AAC.1